MNLQSQKCPTCNLDKNFNPVNLKLKNILMEVLLKGCPADGCDRVDKPMTYEAVIKHLNSECNKIKG
jgi:hypothetical protein